MAPRVYAWLRACLCAMGMGMIVFIPLQDTRPVGAQDEYDSALRLFRSGSLERSQQQAEQGYRQFRERDPEFAARFQLLEAESMLWRGMYEDTLRVLSVRSPNQSSPEATIGRLAIEAVALARLQQVPLADQELSEAEMLCSGQTYISCGTVPRARGILAIGRGELAQARKSFLESLSFARGHQDRWLEATALSNLSVVSLQDDHYDEAVEWSQSAYKADLALGAEDLAENALGNLGWAYFELGDSDRALGMFVDAEKRALGLGDTKDGIKWLTTAGYVYEGIGELKRAAESYSQAYDSAKKMNSKEDIVTSLELLAHNSIEIGKLDEAGAFIDQVAPLVSASGNRLDALDVMLAQGKIAAMRGQNSQAESIFRSVAKDPDSQASMRLGADHELARLFEREGNPTAAGQMYRTALTTFESARAQLKNENSKLPFLANATPIYDDYIQFLVKQGKTEEALLAADQSRARTLAQGLGQIGNKESFRPAAFSPRAVAQKTGATLLFYWLGERQSYLWAVTPQRIALFPLPPRREIVPLVEHYSEALLGTQDPMQVGDEDGQSLYRLLITPALKFVGTNSRVVILSDGALTRLNFETLLAPGPSPIPEQEQGAKQRAAAHYWIDDVTLFSAPSIAMLASAKPARDVAKSLLLIGDPISPKADFPSLPLFGLEMNLVQKSFTVQKAALFSGQQASAAAYLASNPAQYSYIHFVAHAVASRTDPLDSAIILSSTAAGEESFKLYAREIIQRPIDARLVTISACYGSGTRFYAGEGLVGLSWAFLRAGAHSVIGSLWEVSDDSTPRLMEALYQGLDAGQTPEVALRAAKLSMVHSHSKFRVPFYWAPFQLYSRL
jgi:CHAT domain-containing protein/Tfp pilus assembly protein PilF